MKSCVSTRLATVLLLSIGMPLQGQAQTSNALPESCHALNFVPENGGTRIEPFPSITPLIKSGGKVEKSTCAALLEKVQHPAPEVLADLPAYQALLNDFFSNYCHRDVASGWKRDIQLRDTGPYIQQILGGAWTGSEFGTHNAVVIWYSPEFYAFVEQRAAGGAPVMPEGAMAVKEMYDPPSSNCLGEDPIDFKPSEHGVAFFVRHGEISVDGWYWGYFGWDAYPKEVSDLNDKAAVDQYFKDLGTNLAGNQSWQPENGIPGAENISFGPGTGWGAGCLDCHASAESYQTFADLKNITGGTPEDPINTYLSMNFPTTADPGLTKHTTDFEEEAPPELPVDRPYNPAFLLTFDPLGIFKGNNPPTDSSVDHMPSASFDTVWVKPTEAHEKAGIASQYVTSDQCFGCHDVGQTGLLFDMSAIEPTSDPDKKDFIDLAPYGTWRTSPMGLAGRDPVFFAQLASETQTFHEDSAALIENVCLGCHGIQGQRQFSLDQAQATGDCGEFSRAMVDQIPAVDGQPGGEHPNYGALARDGIACTSCHHAIFKKEDIAAHFPDGTPDAQNKCVVERQKLLNPEVEHDTLAATFTGSFLVGDPDKIGGPMPQPKPKPMEQSLGLTPYHDAGFTESDICGTCHTVHLPILHQGQTVGRVFEQTTYAEWAFSEFRTGVTANHPDWAGTLPSGAPRAGKLAVSCQKCHMESSDSIATAGFPEGLVFPDLSPDSRYVSKIATIQEKSNFPAADNTLPAEDIDLTRREGFARHTLVGLNVFFMTMAEQFSHVLGIPKDAAGYMMTDPTGKTTSLPYVARTLRQMEDNARNRTATVSVQSAAINNGVLEAEVQVVNGVGHKFPSGVGFRRAFVEFRVLDEGGNTLWGSGVTNGAGVIMDDGVHPDTGTPIDGELWWTDRCEPVTDRLAFQPHFDTGAHAITKQSQAQIYQELVMAPPPGAKIDPEVPGHAPVKSKPVTMCGTQLEPGDNTSEYYPGWSLTTSFLSICAQAKDNRLLPQGYLPSEDREEIATMFVSNSGDPSQSALDMAKQLAAEGGSWGVGNDPDYNSVGGKPYGGGDTVGYAIPLEDIEGTPATVVAELHYQATPPFYLQDRFCTAEGSDRDRLYYLAGKIDLDGRADDWKLAIASGQRAVSAP